MSNQSFWNHQRHLQKKHVHEHFEAVRKREAQTYKLIQSLWEEYEKAQLEISFEEYVRQNSKFSIKSWATDQIETWERIKKMDVADKLSILGYK